MRLILCCTILLQCFISFCQITTARDYLDWQKKQAPYFGVMFGSAINYGISDNLILRHEDTIFSHKRPDQFYGPDPIQRQLNDHWLVPTAISNGYQLHRSIGLNLDRTAVIGFRYKIPRGSKWWVYVADFTAHFVVYSAGWHLGEAIITY